MYTGPKLTNEDLVFGYDTGYGVASNTTSTIYYPGEQTVNYTTDTSSQGGWTGSMDVVDSSTKTFRFNVSNFNGAAGSGQGWRAFTWDLRAYAGQSVTISATVEVPDETNGIFSWIKMGQTNTHTSNGSGAGMYMGYSPASDYVNKSTKTKERISWSGTLGNSGTASQPSGNVGFTVWYNGGTAGTAAGCVVSNIQIELNAHETPFVNGTRSSTASLIDLKRTTSIDVSNVSFDSTGQPAFDGTDDKGVITNFPHIWNSSLSVESVVSWDDDTRSVILGNFDQGAGGHDINFEKNPSGTLRFYWDRGSRNVYSSANAVTTAGAYHHVVFVRDVGANNFRFYVDGELVTTVTNAGSNIPTTGSTFRFGADTRNGATVHNGSIPVIKAYSRVLTAAEITSNYNAYKNRFNI